jgi:hypothetical protein
MVKAFTLTADVVETARFTLSGICGFESDTKTTRKILEAAQRVAPDMPPVQRLVGKKIGFPNILYVCEVCFAGNQESCGNDRDRMNIVPDGRWLCDGCRDDEDIDVSACKGVPELFTSPPAAPSTEMK